MSRKRHRLVVAIVTLLLLALSPLGASAQDDAGAQFKAALEKFHAGEYEAALPTLREVADTTDSPNARLYVARSLRELGRLDEAYDEMHRTVRDATEKAKTEERYISTRDAAAAELADLELKVGKLIVVIVGEPADPAVTLNGNALAGDRLGKPVPVLPGSVHVEANAPGKATFSQDVDVAAGKVETITVSLHDGEATPGDGAGGDPEADDVPTSGGEIRLAGYGVAGLGVVGMVLFGVGKAMGDKKFNEVKDACGATRCTDPAFADDIDAGKRFDSLATAGLVIGIAGLAGGAAMIIFGGPTEDQPEQALSLGAGPGDVGVGLTGTF